MPRTRVYTADDEAPKCMRCDNLLDDEKCDQCGPQNWWYYYKRTERIEESDETIEQEISRRSN